MKLWIRSFAIALVCALAAVTAFSFVSIPVRGSSGNGEDSNAAFWNLFGPAQSRTLTKGTTSVGYKFQVVCPNQTVTAALNPSDAYNDGACEDASYLFIYQLHSTATNVNFKLSKLVGFTPNANTPTYGVMLCDSPNNTMEMCTNTTQAQLPAITFATASNNTVATFTIPNFPAYPAGTNHQGQGLTLFVLTKQGNANPVDLPVPSLQ